MQHSLNEVMCIYGAASPTPPPCGWVMVPPPLWLWGCGGALLVSDAADCGVGNGGVVVVVVVVVVEVVVVVVIW